MKRGLRGFLGLTLLAALAEGLILIRIRIDPWRLAALLESVALLLGAFVGLTEGAFIKQLRAWAASSLALAAGLPFLLLAPYLIFGLGTRTFSLIAFAKLIAYILVPTALLLPDRLRHRENLNWRDVIAMVALAVPVSAGWLQGIWVWPQDIYVFRPIFCVLVGGYAFMVLRGLEGVGFRLLWRKRDISYGLLNLLAYAILAIPIGITLNFIHPHATAPLTRAGGTGAGGKLPVLVHWNLSYRRDSGGNAFPRHPAEHPGAYSPQGTPGAVRHPDRLGGVRLGAPAPSAGPQLAIRHPGDTGGSFLWQRLPHSAAPVRFRSDPRHGGRDLAFLVLTSRM